MSERLTPPYMDLHERGSYDTDELDALTAASKCVLWWGPFTEENTRRESGRRVCRKCAARRTKECRERIAA